MVGWHIQQVYKDVAEEGHWLINDELLMTLAEVEMILNSKPLPYLSVDDHEEPLTPSHLIIGRQALNLLDISIILW